MAARRARAAPRRDAMIDKPLYRVAAAGLDPRDARLIEIVFKHSQYNRYEFRMVSAEHPDDVDILLANTDDPAGADALARLRVTGREIPVVAAVPRGTQSTAKHVISLDRLTLQLLPMLNRVVELDLDAPDTRPMVHATAEAGGDADGFQATQPGPMPMPAPIVRTPAAPVGSAASVASGVATATASVAPAASPVAHRAEQGSQAPVGLVQRSPQAAAGAAAAALARSARPTSAEPPVPMPVPATSRELPAGSPSGRSPTVDPASMRRGTGGAAPQAAPRPAPVDEVAGFGERDLPAQRVRVLIVDDSPTVRQQMATAFARMGASCALAADAGAALEQLETGHFDLAFVDVVMPDVDGYRLTREIRRRRRGLPVVILTSRSSPFDLARGALAGCETFLVKPVPLRKLEEAIVKSLRKAIAIDDVGALLRLPSTWKSPAGGASGDGRAGRGPRSD